MEGPVNHKDYKGIEIENTNLFTHFKRIQARVVGVEEKKVGIL